MFQNGVGLLVGRAGMCWVPRLVLAGWCVDWVLTRQPWGCGCPGAGVHLLVGEVRAQGSCAGASPQRVKLGPRPGVCTLAGGARSCGL